MLHLGMPECNSANELVKNLGLDKAAISRSVSRLTKLGLIVSERDPENGARYILRFTALGRVQSQRIASFTYARESHLLKVLTEGERTLFLASLQKVLKNVEPVNELVAQGRFWD